MAFTPLLTDLPISAIINNTNFRNTARETLAGGTPVYFVPPNWSLNQYGYGGPKYQYGYTYNNSPDNHLGNCTWWCWGRLLETMGTSLGFIATAKNWYANYSGSKSTDASSIQPGDIIVYSDSSDGHVMFVEDVQGSTIYISHSAYSTKACWSGYAARVGYYSKSDIYAGNSINMYKDIDNVAHNVTVVGVLHTGGAGPTPPTPPDPPTPTETPVITVDPASYTVTMNENETSVDFTFDIEITGIPLGESASGGNTYPELIRIYNSGWSYDTYTVNGVTYQRAYKRQILRYIRESMAAYSTTKYMYYNLTFSNGSVSSTTPMVINVKASDDLIVILNRILNRRRERKAHINVL